MKKSDVHVEMNEQGMKSAAHEVAEETLQKNGGSYPCPHCGAMVILKPGAMKCPECGNEIVVSVGDTVLID